MADAPTPPADETPEQLRERIKELERRVAGLTFENDGLKAVAYPLIEKELGLKPMTEEEARAILAGPHGDVQELWDIMEKHEREYLAEGGDDR